MSTPQVPTITNSKATLNAADTATLTAAVFAVSPLPAQKAPATVRQIIITLVAGAAGAQPTSTVAYGYNP